MSNRCKLCGHTKQEHDLLKSHMFWVKMDIVCAACGFPKILHDKRSTIKHTFIPKSIYSCKICGWDKNTHFLINNHEFERTGRK